MRAQNLVGDDPGVAVLTGQGRQHSTRLGTERNNTPPGLRVPQLDAIVLDVFPAQELDFEQPTADSRSAAEGGDRLVHDGDLLRASASIR